MKREKINVFTLAEGTKSVTTINPHPLREGREFQCDEGVLEIQGRGKSAGLLRYTRNDNRVAFTLAEVLITLGIIGIVAALTIPTLIANHQKKIVETRLQKFYTTFNQALLVSINQNGNVNTWELPDYYDYEASYQAWEKYFKPYIKHTAYTKKKVVTLWPTAGVDVYLPDGSAFNLSGNWVTFYPNAKNRSQTTPQRDTFLFLILQKGILQPYEYNTKEESKLIANCSHTDVRLRRTCSALIMRNNWKINDKYPW